ncbi:autorepressor SdpR family transcription factor [Bacteroidota bacterium]
MNKLFKALDDVTRRQILELLKDGDMTSGEIAEKFNISKPSISYHLDLLRQGDLVISEKKGQFVYYSLNTSVLDDTVRWFFQLTKSKLIADKNKSGEKNGN